MEFTRESLLEEVDREYGGLVLTDAPGGPVTIRSYLRLATETIKLIDKATSELDAEAERREDGDYERVRELLIDRLALASDRPDDFRAYSGGFDLATLRVLTKRWTEATQGEAPPQ